MTLNPQARKIPTGKIELSWTPDPTVFGWRFWRDGIAVSKSTNPAQHLTTFAAETDGQAHRYGVSAAIEQVSESVLFPDVAPLPTGKPPVFLFDGTQTQRPYGYDGFQAKPTPNALPHTVYGDLTLDKTTFGFGCLKFDSGVSIVGDYQRAQAFWHRTVREGLDDIYVFEWYFPDTMNGSRYLLAELNYQALPPGPPTIAPLWKQGAVELELQSGRTEPVKKPAFEFNSTNGQLPRMWLIPAARYKANAWHQAIVAVHNARDKTGTIWAAHRVKGDPALGSWATTVNMPAGIAATLQYPPSGNMPQNTIDLISQYRQASTTRAIHFCRLHGRDDGTRWASVADAKAWLG